MSCRDEDVNQSQPLPKQIGIGLIERGGRFLIRRRPPLPGSPMPGVWEFPGGKCEFGESPEDATIRECKEETGLDVSILGLRRVTTHTYPHGTVVLHYFDAILVNPGAEPSVGSDFRWIAASELPELTFPEANGPILAELADEFGASR